MNGASDKSTNHSQTKIQKSKGGSEHINFEELPRKMVKGKENYATRRINDRNRRKETVHKLGVESSNNKVRSNRKAFTNIRNEGEIMT